MQIISPSDSIQILQQIEEASSQLFGIFLDSAGEAIAINLISLWNAIVAHEWGVAITFVLTLLGLFLIDHRLVRNNLLDSAEHLFSKIS